jgi:DcuC family C4-dicarboxylate transporter
VVGVGFMVNIPIISQTSTAVCIGPVVVPLMRAAGYSMPTIGASVLLGASLGGELLNPGAPELQTVYRANPNNPSASPQSQATGYLPRVVFTQLVIATLLFWGLSAWRERAPAMDAANPDGASTAGRIDGGCPNGPSQRINLLKAFVPLVPLGLLFVSGPPLHLVEIPDHWVMTPKDGQSDPAYHSRLIGLAMLVGVVVAALVTPSRARDCVKEFFEGAGYGYTHIISLIVTANCFGKAIESAGLAQALGRIIAEVPELLQPLAALVPMTFAAVSGSGMASTQSLYGFFHAPALALEIDPVSVGALVSVGAAAGRTMSPVAAVALMCATMTGTNPIALVKRVAAPLFFGIAAVVVLRMFQWL